MRKRRGNSTSPETIGIAIIMLFLIWWNYKKKSDDVPRFTEAGFHRGRHLTVAGFYREYDLHITKDMSQQDRINPTNSKALMHVYIIYMIYIHVSYRIFFYIYILISTNYFI